MSFFGSIGKFLGGVAKTGLSVVTHGISDQILGALKGRGDAKKAADAPMLNAQQEALANKMAPLAPKVKRTEQYVRDATVHLAKESKPRKPSKYSGDPTIGVQSPEVTGGSYRRSRRRSFQRRLAAAEQGSARKPAKARSGAKRTVPSGGLDLKRIASMWRAEGKPGDWRAYIKAHSDIRKA